jgi:quercetin dioxygenase-like cupin family protein
MDALDQPRGCILTGRFLPNVFRMAALAGVCALQPQSVVSQERPGITHAPLLKSELPNTPGQEVIVWDTQYAPGAVNPRHLHPAAITFHVLSGTGVWEEDGKPPVTLHAGESLFVPAGTIHAHWNPSTTETLRFLEFIVSGKDKGRSEKRSTRSTASAPKKRQALARRTQPADIRVRSFCFPPR